MRVKMKTFAERLKIAINKREISQAEAARRCGIAQQSFNYIITNNLASSKLAPKIAAALNINPEWLILGRGKFEDSKIYELPLIHSPYMLKKFLNKDLDFNSLDYIAIDVDLGELAFAYLIASEKIAICSMTRTLKAEYLKIVNSNIVISEDEGELSFPIFEWRIRNVDF